MSHVAKEISDYLLTGMHHSTREGQAAIDAIITARLLKIAKNERIEAACAGFWHQEHILKARAELLSELPRNL